MSTKKESPETPTVSTASVDNAELTAEIKRLNTSVLTMRSMINELIVSHNELKEQVTSIQRSQDVANAVSAVAPQSKTPAALQERELENNWVAAAKKEGKRKSKIINGTKTCQADAYKRLFASQDCPADVQSTDEEIDEIIARRKSNGEWPVRNKTYLAFTTNQELLKIRFHHSEKYNHIPVRIDSSSCKDSRARCKLCMAYNRTASKGCGRNTSWMCSTCEVPLCVKCLIGEDDDVMKTHHARWHIARDLVAENDLCHREVIESRAAAAEIKGTKSGKRKAESIEEAAIADEVDMVTQEENLDV